MNRLAHQLWVSGISSVRTEDTSKFDRIVTVCQDSVKDNVGCEYAQFELADDPQNAKRYGGETSYDVFEEAANAVYEALVDEEAILVHCHAGQNRSVAVSIAALARLDDLKYDDVFEMAVDRRPIANPTKMYASYARRYILESNR